MQKKQLHEDMIFFLALLNKENYLQLLEIFELYEGGKIGNTPKTKIRQAKQSKQNCAGSQFKGIAMNTSYSGICATY